MNSDRAVTIRPIGVIRTCFVQKFGIPRQAGLIREARGTIELDEDFRMAAAVKGLEGFSHLWVLFLFHANVPQEEKKSPGWDPDWKPVIRPPRLGGVKKIGVFASRSPHRPNSIGMSVVRIEKIHVPKTGPVRIDVSGVDLLDGTPVIDLKPYVPYADRVPRARSGWATEPIKRHRVHFEPRSLADLKRLASEDGRDFNELKSMARGILALDPRPASQQRKLPLEGGEKYGFALYDYDILWRGTPQGIRVTEVRRLGRTFS